MKFSAVPLLWGIIACLLFLGCSQEENLPPPRQKQKVVRPTEMPPVEKEKPVSTLDEKKGDSEEPKRTFAERAAEKKPHETKEKPEDKGEQGRYAAKDGDSLTTIAGRAEIYKDPLKWLILLRFNLEELGRLPETPDFAERKLPAGTRLKIVMPRQSMGGKKKADGLWVANVVSSRSNDEIVPLAVSLVKRGFPMYMTRAQVKGQEWMRLRVGFFADKAEAQQMGKKIKEAVQVEEPWILKVGKEEYGEFAGFLERESGS